MTLKNKNKGYVYTLILENDKYYVGFTRDLELRIHQHCQAGGSEWCIENRPISVLSVQEGNENLEIAQTALMMSLYGWENVRGASYCKVNMNRPPPFMESRNQDMKFQTGIKQQEN